MSEFVDQPRGCLICNRSETRWSRSHIRAGLGLGQRCVRIELLQVGVKADSQRSLAMYNKCIRFDAGDVDDDEDTISQEAFVAMAFQALCYDEEHAWRNSVAFKLTRSMFENRCGQVVCSSGLSVDVHRIGLTEAWRRADKNGNGTIDLGEFRSGLKQVCPDLMHSEVTDLSV